MGGIWKNITVGLALCLLLGCTAAARHGSAGAAGTARLRDLGNGTCLDAETGLTWQATPAPFNFATWEEADQYVRQLDLGGHSDWRLPTDDELYELHDTVERRLAGDCPIKPEICVWSGSSPDDAKSGYWYGYPTCGGEDYGYTRKKDGAVRAVRP